MILIGGVNMGDLPNYLFFFSNGSIAADWMDAKHGYLGDVAVNGLTAKLHTNAGIPYGGTIYTNDTTLGDWQDIVDANPGQAFSSLNQTARISGLHADLVTALQQINALPVTVGYESRSSGSLDGLNTQNGINEVFVINITSGFDVSNPINITGDAGDVYILRWDEDANPTNGYGGRVRFRQGGAIVPHGGLIPTNFINVAGQLDSAGGGSTPAMPYPQGPRYSDGLGTLIVGGSDWTSGGFFTGYWLTTGKPTTLDPETGLYYGVTSSLGNCTVVGGWYTLTTQFLLTAQSGGVHVSPNPATSPLPQLSLKKFVSLDDGITWISAPTPPGPTIPSYVTPKFKVLVRNSGNVPLYDIQIEDDVFGPISLVPDMMPDQALSFIFYGAWVEGAHQNTATAVGTFEEETVFAQDSANYLGVRETPAISLKKYVSVDHGATWLDANTPPGPLLPEGVTPQFKYVVKNVGDVVLSNITVTDDVLGEIAALDNLSPGETKAWILSAL